MGKSLPCTTSRLHQLARLTSSKKLNESKKPISKNHTPNRVSDPSKRLVGESEKLKLKMEKLNPSPDKIQTNNNNNNNNNNNRMPLAMVVSDCAKRWFQDALEEAKGGDITMQVLVGQMYCSGYGIPRDPQKGKAWLTRASRTRSSVWRVGSKRPGYNASDSDSDDLKERDL